MQDESYFGGPGVLLEATEFAQLVGWPVDLLAKACEAHRIFCLMRDGTAL